MKVHSSSSEGSFSGANESQRAPTPPPQKRRTVSFSEPPLNLKQVNESSMAASSSASSSSSSKKTSLLGALSPRLFRRRRERSSSVRSNSVPELHLSKQINAWGTVKKLNEEKVSEETLGSIGTLLKEIDPELRQQLDIQGARTLSFRGANRYYRHRFAFDAQEFVNEFSERETFWKDFEEGIKLEIETSSLSTLFREDSFLTELWKKWLVPCVENKLKKPFKGCLRLARELDQMYKTKGREECLDSGEWKAFGVKMRNLMYGVDLDSPIKETLHFTASELRKKGVSDEELLRLLNGLVFLRGFNPYLVGRGSQENLIVIKEFCKGERENPHETFWSKMKIFLPSAHVEQ